jgi:hypothetical protein
MTQPGPIIRGREAVSAMQPLLAELGRRTGMYGLLDQVHLLVKAPTALRKIPTLVLVGLRRNVRPWQATANDLDGAVLLYEYTMAGLPTGIYATDDIHGARTVLARPEDRVWVAEQACHILSDAGAAVCLVSVDGVTGLRPRLARAGERRSRSCRIGLRLRTQLRDLTLKETMDETMEAFGKSTRRNFRRYRQRAEAELGATFVPRVRLSPEEFLELNANSSNTVSVEEAAWRYHVVTSNPDALFSGLRDGEGRWLSLIAGSRAGEHTRIDWQMNRLDLPRFSLSTVLRSYLLEHEIYRGTRLLTFNGGTPHTMGDSLDPVNVLDVIAVRPGLRGRLLQAFAHRLLPRSNFLGRALEDSSLAWIA